MRWIKNACRNWLDSRPFKVFDRPVFILAAPRSGSTFLYDLLIRFEDAWGAKIETDEAWWRVFSPARCSNGSAYVGAEHHTPEKARLLRRGLYQMALHQRVESGRGVSLRQRLALAPIRYVEKTIANCFHTGFLEKEFPDAIYILLLRDPRPTISSMIETWPRTDGRPHPKHMVLNLQNSSFESFSYPVPPGWQGNLSGTQVEGLAWACCQYIEHSMDFLETIGAERKLTLRYEDVVADPLATARRMEALTGLRWGREVEQFAQSPSLSRTTASKPDPDKWRRLHGPAIEAAERIYAKTMRRMGYPLDPRRLEALAG